MTITPTLDEILALSSSYTLIPVCCEVFADLATPITILRKIAETSSRCFLLESVEGGEAWGRYSFLGYDPVMRVTCKNGEIIFEETENSTRKIRKITAASPYDILRDILKEYKAPHIPGLPPFTGGFVGYFGYSMIGYSEPVLTISKSEFQDFDLMLFDKVIAYDHLKQKICVTANMKTNVKAECLMENYGMACANIE